MKIPVGTFVNVSSYPNGAHPKCVDQFGCDFCKSFYESGCCKKRYVAKSLLRSKIESVIYSFVSKIYKIESLRYEFERSIRNDELYDIEVFTSDDEPLLRISISQENSNNVYEKLSFECESEKYYVIIKDRKKI